MMRVHVLPRSSTTKLPYSLLYRRPQMPKTGLRSRLAAAYPLRKTAAATSLKQRILILVLIGGLYLVTKAIYDPLDALPLLRWEKAAVNFMRNQALKPAGEPGSTWCQLLAGVMGSISKLTRLSNAALTIVSSLVALDAYALISYTIDDTLYDYLHSKLAETGIIATSWTLAGHTFTAVDIFWDVIGCVSALFLRHVPWPFEACPVSPCTFHGAIYSVGCCLHICCWLLLLKQLYLRLLPLLFSQAIVTAQQVSATIVAELSALLQYFHYEQPIYGSLAVVLLLNMATAFHVLWL